jgi:excisionase family DNA binding protein
MPTSKNHADEARPVVERLLTVAEVGEVTNTSERFAGRLIAERRIRYVKCGKYVRVPESAVAEFVAAGTVEANQ